MLSNKELNANKRAFEHAVAQQALEGLTVPKAALDDMKRAAKGEITTSEAIRNAHARFSNVKIFKS